MTTQPAAPLAETHDTTRLGILVMLAAMLLFSLNDALGKWLVATYTVGQVLLLRSIAALIVLSPFLWKVGLKPLLQVERPGLQALRVVISAGESFGFYFAVAYLPLADVMTYWLAAPIYVAALSPLLLGEKVGWRRWTAIFIGFIGVMIALEPSAAALSPPAIISILGSLAFAFIMLLSRTLRGTPDTTLVFWQILGAGALGLFTAPFEWVTPSAGDLVLLGLVGVVSMLGHMGVNRAMKLADAATVVPFEYTLLPWAVIFGWAFFGDVPRPSVLIGGAVIIAAGLFIFFRERNIKTPVVAEH
ncbi:DMT family transporter [Chelativorans sp. J32]|uniref:DMT family transporter n=1 Tax=Chelativorans sp. J32 TaxID=935840 RepID=UPI000486021B|nr:DMT family transporter [Chelativorans sp. J32]